MSSSGARSCVLIPVFNDGLALARTLNSVAQTEGALDVLIVDDGSDPAVLPEMCTCGARAVTILRLPSNLGISSALNTGVEYAVRQGYEYIARLDAGDLVHPARFKRQEEFLDRSPRIGAVGSTVRFVDGSGATLFCFRPPRDGAKRLARAMLIENRLVHSSLMFRSEVFAAVGWYSTELVAAEDYDLLLRVSRRFDLGALDEVLTVCDLRETGISVRRRRRQQLTRVIIQLRYFSPLLLESYAGVLRSLVAMASPLGIVMVAKRLVYRSPRSGTA